MFTEYHCHVLPGIDDGSENVETSLSMLEIMKEHGIERVVFTPHFYCHREKSVERFIEKRQAAFEAIKKKSPIKENGFASIWKNSMIPLKQTVSR